MWESGKYLNFDKECKSATQLLENVSNALESLKVEVYLRKMESVGNLVSELLQEFKQKPKELFRKLSDISSSSIRRSIFKSRISCSRNSIKIKTII